ncbi:MAG: M24 family metallopeptidase, partial [Elusimicrobiales bacterium]|nr:M24 family metallopeptidase [Elusimicrobiales bacterium]
MNIHQKRIKDLQGLLKKNGINAIVLARPLEISFLTGYFMDGVLMLITEDEAFGIMPKMLFDDFHAKAPFVNAEASDSPRKDLIAKKEVLKLKKCVFEPETENYLRGKFWKENGFEEYQGLTAGLRIRKEGEEIEILRKSCKIAAKAFEKLVPAIKTGDTEIEVSNRLDNLMREMGAKGPSFDLIVAFGENGALPHHVTSERKLKDNEPILIDFGCIYKGYCSDITRTFFHGTPGEEFKKVYDIVKRSHDEGIKALKPGLSAKGAD